MYLKKLEIYGFKSFADRTVIEFDRGITAIVGPNGSGKSNVADAIRWVLGEQSAKSLRGSKMEDVIFSGTQKRKPLGFAEVSLTLDNTDGFLPVDFSEITITRRVFRSGESEYYINRSACRLKDIVELFMDTGVGKEGYSIIGQGRIEEIINAHPEERRAIFEEAAGIVKYKSRKEEAVRKLDKTLDNITRVEDILSEISKQLEPLESQSRIAREYLNLRDKLKVYRLNQFILKYDKYTENINQLKEQAILLEQEIENNRLAVNQEEKKCEDARSVLDGIISDIQRYRDLCHELLQNIERLKGEIGILDEKIQQTSKEKHRLEEEIIRGEQKIEQNKKEMDNAFVLLSNYEKDLANALEESSKLHSQINELEEYLTVSRAQVEKKKDSMIDILNSLSQVRNDITRLKTIESNLLKRQDEIENELVSLRKKESNFEEDKAVIEKKVQELEKELEKQRRVKNQLDQIILNQEKDIEDLEERLQIKKQQFEGLRSRLKLLKEMDKEYEGFQKSVKNILKYCEKNPDFKKRICGVVAELIKVPKQYEVAIETALGSSLQYIVTENEEDAKYIIELLRNKKWGRATFLPISAVKGRGLSNTEKAVLKMEGCHGIASELINFAPKYRNVFENLLGRVVITESLDQAVSIARHFSYSFKIVTLDGDVVNPGGSMTGGSRNQKIDGIITRNREITELESQIAQLSAELEEEEDKRNDLYEKHKTALAEADKVSKSLHELEISQATSKEQAERAKQEFLNISAQIDKLIKEQEEIKIEISCIQQSIQKKDEEIKVLESQSSDMEIMTRDTEASIKEAIRKKEELDRQATDKKIFIASIEREIATLKEKSESLNKEIEQHEKAMQDKKAQVEEESAAIQKYRDSIQEKQDKIKEMQDAIYNKNEQINKLQEQKIAHEAEIKNFEKNRKQLSAIIEQITEQKHRIEVQLSKQETELNNLQNSIWEEYEISYANALDFRDPSLTASKIEQGIREINDKINSLGEVNVNAINEYKRIKERFDFLSNQRQDLLNAKDNLNVVIKDITKTMEDKFRQEFQVINQLFNEVFCKLFGGGKAELILQDPENVLESGIEIIAEPPGKKLQNLSLMSGGEKALTAIAILFAILKKKPSPFCVLDEIEAALDENNVYNFGKFIREFGQNTQFVVITHRRGTMESSDVLYGVAMEEKGISKMVSVKLEEAS